MKKSTKIKNKFTTKRNKKIKFAATRSQAQAERTHPVEGITLWSRGAVIKYIKNILAVKYEL